MPNTAPPLPDLWEQVVNRLVFLEKHFVFAWDDLRLHPSELHVLLAARSEPGANATRLAARLGVTKGAVSQVTKRLSAKGVIGKRVDPTQKNEVTIFFTPRGRQALEAFLHSRDHSRHNFEAYLDGLSETEDQTIRRFLEQAAAMLP